MYFYFYDKFVQDKKYEVVLTKIETRLIELGINGRIEKLSLFKNIRELIADGIKKGAHTIVAVGNDRTLSTVVNIVAPYTDVSLGYIPVAEGTHFAKVLGISAGDKACDVLSKRLYKKFDLGRIKDFYFLGSLELPTHTRLELQCDDSYTVSATQQTNELFILNMGRVVGADVDLANLRLAASDDSRLEVVIAPLARRKFFSRRAKYAYPESVFRVKNLEIKMKNGETAEISADQIAKFQTPCAVAVEPKALKMIVGKERLVK